MEILAGLDTGTTGGIGVIRGERLLHAEARHFKSDTDDDTIADGLVFLGYVDWLRNVFERFDINVFAFEQPIRTNSMITRRETVEDEEIETKVPIGNMRTFLRLYGIRGAVLVALHLEQRRRALAKLTPLDIREINNRTWRGKVYGKVSPPAGTTDPTKWWKDQGLTRCKQYGWQITQRDAAEGAMIAEYLRIVRKEEMLGFKPKPNEPDLFGGSPQPQKEYPF